MIRSFFNRRSERRGTEKEDKEMAMRGWGRGEIAAPHQGFAMQRHISYGVGHHFARNAFRGRGIHQMIARGGSRRGQGRIA